MNLKKIIIPAVCSIYLFQTSNAQQHHPRDWDEIDTAGIISADTTQKKGFKLIVINKSPGFSQTTINRLKETFYNVYPKEVKTYNKNSLKEVVFLIDPAYDGVAATAGKTVRYNPQWLIKNPEDIDVVTHEVMHIVQGYGGGSGPGWVTEGIADYVRYRFGVNNDAAKWSLTPFKDTQSYTNAYRITARFLVWIEKKYNKNFVIKLDKAMRDHTYNDDIWKLNGGKTLNELWSAYAANPVI
ncbi:Peptidase [bacterium A37T11]|nr:Peptidase [bacterium A37T11]